MTRIVSRFGIAAALTLGMLSTAAAQVTPTKKPTTTKTTKTTKPTTTIPVTKEVAEVATVHDTVWRRDTLTVTKYFRDTLRVTGATIVRYDTTTVVRTPGWMDRGQGAYFGLGAGPYYPSGGLGGGQIPGYAFQANLGVDPAGSPLGLRVTVGAARPDESQPYSLQGGRPTVANLTADLKLRLPMFKGTMFPMFSLYAVGGGAMVFYKDLRLETETVKTVVIPATGMLHSFGYDFGAGASVQLGHRHELFLEGRVINFFRTGFESNHSVPIILGVNWY